MKTVKNLLFAVLAGTAFFSCTEREPEEPLAPKLTFQQTEVTVPADGMQASVVYVLENPVEGETLEVSVDQEWVTDLSVDDVKVSFSVLKNETEEVREANVLLKYTEDVSASFVIRQDAGEIPPFKIVPNEEAKTEVSMSFTIYPQDPMMTYTAISFPKEVYDELGSPEAIYQKILDFYSEAAAANGYSLQDLLGQILKTGTMENARISGLEPYSENYLIVVGMDTEGRQLTDLVEEYYKLKEFEKVDMDFEILYDIDGIDATMTVKPSLNDHYYWRDYISKKDLEDYGKGIEELAAELLDYNVTMNAMYGYTAEQVVRMMCFLGENTSQMYALKSETSYIGYVFGCSIAGVVDTDVVSEEFITGSIPPSDNVLTLETIEPNVDRVTIKVTASNSDPYVLEVLPSDEYGGMSDEELLEELLKNDYTYNTLSGNWEGNITGLEPESEYLVVVFGYNGGVATTQVCREQFTTLALGNPAEFLFSSDAVKLESNMAEVSISGTPGTVLYLWGLVKSGTEEEEILQAIAEDVEYLMRFGQVIDWLDYMKKYGIRGNDTQMFQKLESETEYVAYAVPVDEEAGKFATSVQFGEPFTTPERKLSPETTTLVHDKYWDGDELTEAYPDLYSFQGMNMYCLLLEVQSSAPMAVTYFAYSEEDLTDTEKYSDDILLFELLAKGNRASSAYYFLPYDVPYTFFAVGQDNEGNYTKVYRALINYGPDGAADIEEFEPPVYSASGNKAIEFAVKRDVRMRRIDKQESKQQLPERPMFVPNHKTFNIEDYAMDLRKFGQIASESECVKSRSLTMIEID